jgi:hemoglobin
VKLEMTIYAALGGGPALARLVEAHHRRCLADEVLNHPFSHQGEPDHLQRLAAYWGEVLGGPALYTERYGDDSRPLAMHAGTGAQDDMGDRFLACFLTALDDAGINPDRHLRQALRDYMTWAVGEYMAVAPHGVAVPEGKPVPRWGWDGLISPTRDR